MHRSEARILTTHVGSLPRPPALTDLLLRREHEGTTDEAALAQHIEAAVREVIQKHRDVGIDIGNDGEQPRVAFHTYVARRRRGFGGEGQRAIPLDIAECPDFLEVWRTRRLSAGRTVMPPQAVSDCVEYPDRD
jgi:5-methyltetrahydropteroyltriglutamate--homocysteine methyltransferase